MRSAVLGGFLLVWSAQCVAQTAPIVGNWNWGAGGGVVEIRADGTGKDARNNSMTWIVNNAGPRMYTLRWTNGYTDTATVSADGKSLTAVNNAGTRFTSTRIESAAGGAPVAGGAIAGKWTWGAGGGVTEIGADGTGRDWRGNSVRWVLRDPATRSYVLTWSHGYTDNLTLSPDGNTLSGGNTQGTRFTATRVGVTPPPPPAALDLNGSWGGGTVHVWQDRNQLLVTATWKREGQWVIWRAEGKLEGSAAKLALRYAPQGNEPGAEYDMTLTVSADGNRIDAVYSHPGVPTDRRSYLRDK